MCVTVSGHSRVEGAQTGLIKARERGAERLGITIECRQRQAEDAVGGGALLELNVLVNWSSALKAVIHTTAI